MSAFLDILWFIRDGMLETGVFILFIISIYEFSTRVPGQENFLKLSAFFLDAAKIFILMKLTLVIYFEEKNMKMQYFMISELPREIDLTYLSLVKLHI